MNVLILSDSRGTVPQGNSYINKLIRLLPNFSFTYFNIGSQFHINTLNKLEEFVIDLNKKFDILIIQVGIHDNGVLPWPKTIWEYYLNTKYRRFEKAFLYQRPPFMNTNLFFYQNEQEEKDCFKTFRKYCKKIVFLSPHGIYLSVFENKVIHFGEDYRQLNLNNINRISKLADETIFLPQDEKFKLKYTMDAGIHYNDAGHNFIVRKIKKALKS